MGRTYAELVAEDTMTPGHEPRDAHDGGDVDAVSRSASSEPIADDLFFYPRDRWEAARDGRMTPEEFAEDIHRHVEEQLPARYRAVPHFRPSLGM